MFSSFILLIAALTQAATPAVPAPSAQPTVAQPSQSAGYVPHRVFDTRRRTFTDFEAMLADLAHADVVLVGEQHDDPNTHRLETAVLQGLTRRSVAVTLSLEMFERDTQPSLDAYLGGTISEEAFLKASRPWPGYATDYRSLVEMAKARRWPVLAANVPRRLAADVSKSGQGVLEALVSADQAFVARDLLCPQDAYYQRFAEQMIAHPPESDRKPPGEQRAMTDRYYWSQCLKDETMAESIAAVFETGSPFAGSVVHFTGAFHSDFGTGTAERVRRRLPGRRVALVSVIPVTDLDALAPKEKDLARAQYLVYTIK